MSVMLIMVVVSTNALILMEVTTALALVAMC